ncbi:VTT domain-containing protein [Pseudorhodoplanes sinuspersici]|uniref:Phospholipase D n=1 Tax=Pseudorhodoplanes sinuspersici TaxID=1235591 RepID=A0A1W6ZVV1_9HYPH|nr:VTT domain-containing protein [Pseudorhodoplanes sinuspersici]ARQ01440.1 hypothetical protein CAK95_21780 [Pseudorhodoplanes sinuspersici]RKE73130.1 phosphatidylserine/phosphatidylglycerophosphate/cardiolipin synthase-like enzyme [Pseudorhodoplanes sinuspersici]
MPASLFRETENVWRIAHANRASMLVDGAACFGAVRESLLKAQHSIYIVGWDIDSRMRLVGASGRADDGLPETLAEFLSALVERRPELTIRLLLWDFSVLYALEREIFPSLALNWKTPDQIQFCLDNDVPLGCSQHQKIVVVDDTVAFSGGLDLTIRRWDTSDHALENDRRVDPFGRSYRPFHDVQAVVDGEAARVLADLVRDRWLRAQCAELPEALLQGDCWPDSVKPDFTEAHVGIARTQPACNGMKEVREVERLFMDMIDAAERRIYIENQFMTSHAIAERLAQRLRRKTKLEAVLVAPNTPESWIETHTMRNGRIRFQEILQKAGVSARVRIVYPEVASDDRTVDTMVHSKIMVVDDRLLRIGSANLNNRSMGADTECDLVIEAKSHRQRKVIERLRNRLLGEHCGGSAEDVAELLDDTGSLVAVADILSRNGHSLRPIEDGAPDPDEVTAYLESLADPPRPVTWRSIFGSTWHSVRKVMSAGLFKFTMIALLLLGLTLAWRLTPLAEMASAEAAGAFLTTMAQSYWGPLAVLGAFLAGGLVAFPVTILIAATAASFGPWLGFTYALIGAMASALLTYAIGAMMGRAALQNILGHRLTDIRNKIARQGVLAVAAIRLVPVAPFTLVNLVAGASGIGLTHYLVGTVLGLLPGLVLMSLLGNQIMRIVASPSPVDIVIFVALIAAWIVTALAIQSAFSKYGQTS